MKFPAHGYPCESAKWTLSHTLWKDDLEWIFPPWQVLTDDFKANSSWRQRNYTFSFIFLLEMRMARDLMKSLSSYISSNRGKIAQDTWPRSIRTIWLQDTVQDGSHPDLLGQKVVSRLLHGMGALQVKMRSKAPLCSMPWNFLENKSFYPTKNSGCYILS